jgi:hypothetical protein
MFVMVAGVLVVLMTACASPKQGLTLREVAGEPSRPITAQYGPDLRHVPVADLGIGCGIHTGRASIH